MIFLACRSGDVIQAFIGLWLVPKYVGPDELGAVLPLQQLTSFLTVPLAIVATVFAKYVNTYAAKGEYGKVKGFIRDVFSAALILFIVCIAGAYLVMPFFYERLRISSGSLTFLILLCGLVGNLGSIIGAAQQGLKRFKTMSLTTLLAAPIRLVTLLIAMPYRALSGYLLGQTTPAATTSALAVLDLHRALKPYTPDRTWRRDWRQILAYSWPIAVNLAVATLCATFCMTVYRQRLPEVESGAFYLISRFSDLASYVGAAISVVMFPIVSEAHEKGDNPTRTIRNTAIILTVINFAITIAFAFTHKLIFGLTATWEVYLPYSYLLPVIAFYSGCSVITSTFITYETACRRFGAMFWILLSTALWVGFLVTFTGANFFHGLLPMPVVDWMISVNAARLDFLSYLAVPYILLQLMVTILIFHINTKPCRR